MTLLSRVGATLAAWAVLVLLLAGAAGAQQASTKLPGGRFVLQDHTGAIVTDADFQGRFMLVYFGYTFCPDVCPTGLTVVSDALELLGDAGARVTPIFITVDPERDTVAAMNAYVEHFHPRLVGLTGPREMIERVSASYKVEAIKVQEPGTEPDNYLMDHTASVFLMSPDGRFLVKFAHGIDAESMAKRIRDFL